MSPYTPPMMRPNLMLPILLAGFLCFSSTTARADDRASSLEQRLDQLVSDWWTPGANEPGAAVLVMVDGKPVLRKGYGSADIETGAKLAPDSIFLTGSITKQFTAVAVLQ